MSYSFSFDENMSEKLEECDFMFCFYKKGDIPSWVWSRIDETCKVYGIGTKVMEKVLVLFMPNVIHQAIMIVQFQFQKNWRN